MGSCPVANSGLGSRCRSSLNELYMRLAAKARDVGRGDARGVQPCPLGASPRGRMAYRLMLQRLARGWPFDQLEVGYAYSVPAVAVLDNRLNSPELGLCDGPDPEGVISDQLHAVQGRFGATLPDLGRVLPRRWMGRKIAFESVAASPRLRRVIDYPLP